MGNDSYKSKELTLKFYVKLTKHKWHKTSNGTIMVWRRDYKEEVILAGTEAWESNGDAHEEV